MKRSKGDMTMIIQLIPTQAALSDACLHKSLSLNAQPYQLALQVKAACTVVLSFSNASVLAHLQAGTLSP